MFGILSIRTAARDTRWIKGENALMGSFHTPGRVSGPQVEGHNLSSTLCIICFATNWQHMSKQEYYRSNVKQGRNVVQLYWQFTCGCFWFDCGFFTVKKGQTPNLPEPALVFVDWGEAVSVDGVEVVLVRDAWGDDFRVHYVALASGAALMQRLEAGREVEVDG